MPKYNSTRYKKDTKETLTVLKRKKQKVTNSSQIEAPNDQAELQADRDIFLLKSRNRLAVRLDQTW